MPRKPSGTIPKSRNQLTPVQYSVPSFSVAFTHQLWKKKKKKRYLKSVDCSKLKCPKWNFLLYLSDTGWLFLPEVNVCIAYSFTWLHVFWMCTHEMPTLCFYSKLKLLLHKTGSEIPDCLNVSVLDFYIPRTSKVQPNPKLTLARVCLWSKIFKKRSENVPSNLF